MSIDSVNPLLKWALTKGQVDVNCFSKKARNKGWVLSPHYPLLSLVPSPGAFALMPSRPSLETATESVSQRIGPK